MGLGASDMKAGLAIMLDLIEQTSSTKPPCDLLFLFSTREETTGSGSERIVEWLSEASYLNRYEDVGGLILEPTDAEFVGVGHRGDTLWNVHAEGPGGHASQTFDSFPAIEKVSRFVAALPSIRKDWNAKYSDTILGAPSVNVTSLKANGKSNVVPGGASAALNLRVTPQLRTYLDEVRANLADTYDIAITQSWEPNPSVSDSETLIYKTMQSVALDLPFKAFPGATDKHAFDRHGIPMLIYGPGAVAAMHQPDEWVEYYKIITCRSVIEHAIRYYAASNGPQVHLSRSDT
jgi:acetylornithine deacetylase/succinyl-diaminopimelate desuccinylase-like protein